MTIIILIVLAIAAWMAVAYNSLVTYRTRSEEALSDIDVQSKRRYDLIPNLVNTVKGYAAHESSAFEKVTEARTRAMQAGTLADKGAAEDMLSGALKSLFAVAEAYPDLKANQNFLQLQNELADTENKIQAARRFYNSNVRELNIKIETFPTNLIAKPFGFMKKEFFALGAGEEAARQPVEVKF